jgi:hypothetical protein
VSFIHTCYRITDPERSVAFYEALGFASSIERDIRAVAEDAAVAVSGAGGSQVVYAGASSSSPTGSNEVARSAFPAAK